MKLAALCAFALYAITGFAPPLMAQDAGLVVPGNSAFRVDDTGTVVLDPVLEMQWQPAGNAPHASLVSASTRVSVQLNVAAWEGRSGRIYMSLPRTSGPTVRAAWKTGGALIPGSLLSGQRSLVFAGPIPRPILRDLIEITLEADGSRLVQPEALSFGFEIEVDR
ncbi:MAG: hypothetical protein ACKOUT_08165 [Novosphingobium sp.]